MRTHPREKRQIVWEQQHARSLNFSHTQRFALRRLAQPPCFLSEPVQNVPHERVHRLHRLLRNTHVWVQILEKTVDVRVVLRLSLTSASNHVLEPTHSMFSGAYTFSNAN